MNTYSLSVGKEKTKGRNRYNTTYPYILPTYIHKKPLPAPLPPPPKKKDTQSSPTEAHSAAKTAGVLNALTKRGNHKVSRVPALLHAAIPCRGEGIKKTPRVLLAFCRHTNLRQIPCSYRLEMYVECIWLSLPILQTAYIRTAPYPDHYLHSVTLLAPFSAATNHQSRMWPICKSLFASPQTRLITRASAPSIHHHLGSF